MKSFKDILDERYLDVSDNTRTSYAYGLLWLSKRGVNLDDDKSILDACEGVPLHRTNMTLVSAKAWRMCHGKPHDAFTEPLKKCSAARLAEREFQQCNEKQIKN